MVYVAEQSWYPTSGNPITADVVSEKMFPGDTVWTPTMFTEKAKQLFLSCVKG